MQTFRFRFGWITVIALSLSTANIVEGFEPSQLKPTLFSLGLSARPTNFVPDNIQHIDGLPFAGFTYNLPATFTLMHSVQYGAWTEQDIHDQFGGLNFHFQNLTRNFVGVVVRRNGVSPAAGDFFDDAAWSTTIQQFALLASVARTPGYQCVGIVFDNEEYFEGVWNYPDDVAFAATRSLAEYQAKARERGQQVMSAIKKVWPEAVVLVTHGPYRSTPEKRPFEVSMNQVGDWTEYELDAPFFFGMAEVANDKQVFDGGEVYQLRSHRQFRINSHWRRKELKNSTIVPPSLAKVYERRVGVTHGLYNLTWPTSNDLMNPDIMRSTLRRALLSADNYVWMFVESGETWLQPNGFPVDWRDSIVTASRDAARYRQRINNRPVREAN